MAVAPTYITSAFTRISAAIFLVRLFASVSWLKWYLTIITSVLVVLTTLLLVVYFTFARPISCLWTDTPDGVIDEKLKQAAIVLTIAMAGMFDDSLFQHSAYHKGVSCTDHLPIH